MARKKGDNKFYLLDKVSQKNIRVYENRSKLLTQYEIRTYYCYHEQRALHFEEIKESLLSTEQLDFKLRHWQRIIDFKYSKTPLSAKGSTIGIGGRFNYGESINPISFTSFNGLYLAEDRETAFREKFGIGEQEKVNGLSAEEIALTSKDSISVLSISGEVQNIFDITKKKNLSKLNKILSKFKPSAELRSLARQLKIKFNATIKTTTELQDSILEENWRERPIQFEIPANPQIFGKMLYDCGFEGILYPSVRDEKNCLVLFPANFNASTSFIEVKDPPKGISCTRLDADSFKKLI